MSGDPRLGELAEWVAYLKDIGVHELATAVDGPVTVPTGPTAAEAGVPPPASDPPAADSSSGGGSAAEALRLIREDLGECTRCKLHANRTTIVFGVGSPTARMMFVGEGPGAEEDARGEPFVGRAGKKLDEMIESIGLSRAEVYIANIVKCRPPRNRDPEKDEIETCVPFLTRQIEAIRPKVIVALGSPAAKTLLGTRTGITRLRGQWHDFFGTPVMPTFHPAYLLRVYTRENRLKVWEDLKAAKARIDG